MSIAPAKEPPEPSDNAAMGSSAVPATRSVRNTLLGLLHKLSIGNRDKHIPPQQNRRLSSKADYERRAASSSSRRSAAPTACRAASTASGLTDTDVIPSRTRCSANAGLVDGA